MQQLEFFYPDFDPDKLYAVPQDCLEWIRVELKDGRVVPILIPHEYKTVKKCTYKTKCTDWSCVTCYDNSFMVSDKVRLWIDTVSPRMIARTRNAKH